MTPRNTPTLDTPPTIGEVDHHCPDCDLTRAVPRTDLNTLAPGLHPPCPWCCHPMKRVWNPPNIGSGTSGGTPPRA